MQTIIKKEKINRHEYNIQELWDTIKRPNLRIHGVEEGAETHTKDTGKLFNKVIENSPNLCNDLDTLTQEAF
jgi:hypothetical protein